MNIQPYLCFEGQAEDAIEFYKKAVGATCEVLMRMSDAPEGAGCGEGPPPPGDKVMHADLVMGETTLHVSDGMCSGKPEFKGIALSMTLDDEDKAKGCYAALAEGGTSILPLHATFFSPLFGMVKDKFGITWNVMVKAPASVPA